MKRVYWAAALAAVACLSVQARADVKPFALFGDGMALQQGVKCPVWGTADPGEEVSAGIGTGEANAVASPPVKADKDGRWMLQMATVQPGGPYTLTLHGKNTVTIKDVYVGEVWVASGQSNMEMALKDCAGGPEEIAKSKNPKIRLFKVSNRISAEPTTELTGKWVECGPDTVANFSGVAYYFGRDLQKARNVPVGLIESNWGGTVAEAWTPKANLEANPDLKKLIPAEIKIDKQHPNPNQGTALFNGMINPLLPFAIKGVIWYQGESNAGSLDQAYQYRTLFPTMIQGWREQWNNPDMPFLFVQLAPYNHNPKELVDTPWAELREAQLLTSEKVKNTGMAVITDVGDENNIHPKRKEAVGGRLALAALAIGYGEKIVYSGPIYEGVKIDGNKAVLSFRSLGQGLEAKDGPLTGFTMAGEDKKFHEAKAEIKGDTVVVTCDAVDKPAAVRFGWTNTPVVNLFNKDGLPASPFRTDDFALSTQPKTR